MFKQNHSVSAHESFLASFLTIVLAFGEYSDNNHKTKYEKYNAENLISKVL